MSSDQPARVPAHKRVHWLRYWFGRCGLRNGWCPACNSSPPRQQCRVCEGSYAYGPVLTERRRRDWRMRWDALCGRTDA